MSNPLLSFSLASFRCFRHETTLRAPRHVNVVAGQNNTGKSTLLLALRRLTTAFHPIARPYHGIAYLGGDKLTSIRFVDSDISHGADELILHFNDFYLGDTQEAVARVSLHGRRLRENQLAVYFSYPGVEPKLEHESVNDRIRKGFLELFKEHARKILYIPAQRRLSSFLHNDEAPPSSESQFDGDIVLSSILQYANPPIEARALNSDEQRQKLTTIEKTMSSMVGSIIKLRPLPAERDIEIDIEGKSVALRRVGTGLEQLLIIAVALSEFPQHLLLIEEPENFLHPTWQRRLLQLLLQREGGSLITTHSNHLLDIRSEEVAYFRTFRQSDRWCTVEPISGNQRYDAIWDLGARPSSLFESNAVIWVEGPSDAILCRAWLSLMPEAKGLTEGIDYMFAFHSGSLLDKFVVDWNDNGVEGDRRFVNFCKLHPNFFILADSDGTPDVPLGHDYLRAIVADMSKMADNRKRLWITQGKEIENYLSGQIFIEYLEYRAKPRQTIKQIPTSETLRWKRYWQI